MDWYSIVKFLHVAFAVVWVGGGFTIMLLAVRADRTGNVEQMLQTMRATGELGNRLFMPASMLTLLSGLVLCWFWIGFGDLWIVLGLLGFATTALIGSMVFKPTADRMAAMIAKDGVTPAALDAGRSILRIARLDYAVMLIAIADMVLKPSSGDTAILAAMAAVLSGGLFAAFGSVGRTAQAAA
jgi:uncharacterized membrane protein